jgi:hypothetical protein
MKKVDFGIYGFDVALIVGGYMCSKYRRYVMFEYKTNIGKIKIIYN